MVSRPKITETLHSKIFPEIHPVVTCYPDQTVGEIGNKFIKSSVYVLMVIDRKTNAIVGIITLHDLLRAQAAIQN